MHVPSCDSPSYMHSCSVVTDEIVWREKSFLASNNLPNTQLCVALSPHSLYIQETTPNPRMQPTEKIKSQPNPCMASLKNEGDGAFDFSME